MNNKRQRSLILVTALCTMGLLMLIAAWVSSPGVAGASTQTLELDHQLLGGVEFEWASTGTYTTAQQIVMTSTALTDLGMADLGLLLQDNGGAAIGYVDLENTLVFTGEHSVDVTIGSSTALKDVGPSVSGSFDGTTLELLSQKFTLATQSGELVQRQFWLSGSVTDGIASGEYRETVWGLTLQPMTLVGGFELAVIDAEQLVPTAVTGASFATNTPTVTLIVVALVAVLAATTVVTRRKAMQQ